MSSDYHYEIIPFPYTNILIHQLKKNNINSLEKIYVISNELLYITSRFTVIDILIVVIRKLRYIVSLNNLPNKIIHLGLNLPGFTLSYRVDKSVWYIPEIKITKILNKLPFKCSFISVGNHLVYSKNLLKNKKIILMRPTYYLNNKVYITGIDTKQNCHSYITNSKINYKSMIKFETFKIKKSQMYTIK